ncbi:hypothetical protein AB4Z46_22090 [Variovorax sp. M-6]|uniref:hypothetical protein n=1 Tax=Variovorax sp. M-6 TaxID=3233041 RepID=UPI003F9CAC51
MAAAKKTPTSKKKPPRATVRTYRHGLGDCHLVTLYGARKARFQIMIDCGVILGTPDAGAVMTEVMDDILAATGGSIDLLVATHEHWDHVSGFAQAAESFAKLKVGAVWMGWTEDPKDADAIKLRRERDSALALLQAAAARMQVDGGGEPGLLSSVLDFFGAAARITTASALELVRAKVARPRYCDPKDAPVALADFRARIYTLGPPRDIRMLKKTLPSASAPETYGMALAAAERSVGQALSDPEQQPFSNSVRIPNRVAQSTPFFQQRYWNDDDWRRIDVAWMDDASELALALDSMTNNTSLVLAIDLADAGVLLFAADAQVGNWLSWDDCKWRVNGKQVTGPDLLARTVYYKVGHHGSHNATLRAEGLERMKALDVAVIPVDHAMALKKKWGDIPLDTLVTALDRATTQRGYVLRTDQEPSATATRRGARSTRLHVEVDI